LNCTLVILFIRVQKKDYMIKSEYYNQVSLLFLFVIYTYLVSQYCNFYDVAYASCINYQIQDEDDSPTELRMTSFNNISNITASTTSVSLSSEISELDY